MITTWAKVVVNGRTNDIECQECGEREALNLPASIDNVREQAQAFALRHQAHPACGPDCGCARPQVRWRPGENADALARGMASAVDSGCGIGVGKPAA